MCWFCALQNHNALYLYQVLYKLTTYGPNPRRHWIAGFILYTTHTHKYTQFQAQCILNPGCHVCTHLRPKHVKACSSMDMQSLKTQHFSQQLITRAKDGKSALLLQQNPPTNLWNWDKQPQWDTRNSLCLEWVPTLILFKHVVFSAFIFTSLPAGWTRQPCHRTQPTSHSLKSSDNLSTL